MRYLEISPTTENDSHNALVAEITVASIHSQIVKGERLYLTLPWVIFHHNLPRISQLRIIRVFSESLSALKSVSEALQDLAKTEIKEYNADSNDLFYAFTNKKLMTKSRAMALEKREQRAGKRVFNRNIVKDDNSVYIYANSSSNNTRYSLRIVPEKGNGICLDGHLNSYGLSGRENGNMVFLPVFI